MTKAKFDFIRKARVMAGYTQEEVSTVLEINIGTYSLKEQGKSEFTASELKKLSELLETSVDILLA